MPTTIQTLDALISDPRMPEFLAFVLGPIVGWLILFFPAHFFIDKKRVPRKGLLFGVPLLVLPYLVVTIVTLLKFNPPDYTAELVSFLTQTGALLVGWSISALITNPLNLWYAKRHAKRLSKLG